MERQRRAGSSIKEGTECTVVTVELKEQRYKLICDIHRDLIARDNMLNWLVGACQPLNGCQGCPLSLNDMHPVASGTGK